MNWTQVEDAIFDFVVAASGLPAEKVIWSAQDAPRPEAPFIAMRLGRIEQVGHDWTKTVDNPGSTGSDGEELILKQQGLRHVSLSLQAFTVSATGAQEAARLLELVRTKATLPSLYDALKASEVSIFEWGPVLAIDGVINSINFEPRATVEARLLLHSEVSEYSTYIESVEMTNEIPDPDSVFTVDT